MVADGALARKRAIGLGCDCQAQNFDGKVSGVLGSIGVVQLAKKDGKLKIKHNKNSPIPW